MPPLEPSVSPGNDENLKAGSISHLEALPPLVHGLSEEDAQFLESFPDDRRKKVLRKIDWRLVPSLAVLYIVTYLDRANIANAKIEGMLDDLGMSGVQYNIAVSVFFVPYILCEIPSNSIMARMKRPSYFMGTITLAWGIVMTMTGIVKNFGGLLATRVLLGLAEGGFFPAAVYIVSQWYLPSETQFRIALFYTSSALSGAFSGLLAYAIAKMDGIGGLEGWRWIFIIEGLMSVVAGIVCFFVFVDLPAMSTSWLDPDEIRYLELRQIAYWRTTSQIVEVEKTRKWKILKSVFLDWHIYLLALIYWSNTAPNYGLKFSMPQLIASMGYSSSKAQLLTIPPYMVGAFSALISGFFSDRFRWRMPFLVCPLILVVIAYAILFSKSADLANNIPLCYFAVCLACLGLYPIIPGTNAWTINNLAGPTKKAQGAALMLGLGNIGGIIGSYMYLDKEAPRYPTGYGLSFGFAALGIVSALALEYGLWRHNKTRSAMSEDEVRAKYTDDELAALGDRSPLFRYVL